MADDDPFTDLGDTLDDNGNDGDDEAELGAEPDAPNVHDPMATPAFSYDEAKQRPVYAREETIDHFDAWMRYELEGKLSERGYQDIYVRELTDTLLRTVVEEELVEKVAKRFEGARE
ncbi:hypothetical protein [Halolamina sediminis]|uniref:hypothetical protein n=1 Tax=Halolamina sediminis TaxID=1480675 RepID=UPI0006B4BE74|nr:hypothetical protein [Halolamina sediminis]